MNLQTTTATGTHADQLTGVSMARDGAVYRTTKKKLKSVKQSRGQESNSWANY